MLLKSNLEIKYQSQYNEATRLLQHSSANRQGMPCALPGGYHSVSYTRVQFYHSKVTPLTDLADVTVQGLFNYNSTLPGDVTTAMKEESST